ncbi:DUF397 domain-containing protein [Actinoplanes sp. NPDC000266]
MSSDTGWIISSRSTGNGGSCVEARRQSGQIEVRNSNAREAGTVVFTTEEWDSFLFGAKRGEFDQLLND